MQKISIAELDIRQAFEGIECPQEYKSAVYHILRNGYVDFAVEQIISNALATNTVEAIRYWVTQNKKEQSEKPTKVFLSDMEKTSDNKMLYEKIDLKLGKEKVMNSRADLTQAFGVRGHDAIPKLFSGDLNFKLSTISLIKEKVTQRELSFGGPDGEFNFDIKNELINPINYSQKLKEKHIKKIAFLWERIIKTMEQDMFPASSKTYDELVESLSIIFGNELNKAIVLGKKSESSEYLLFLTILTWATATIYYQSIGTKVLFREIRLFHHHYDVSLGRIDAIEVTHINGAVPTREQTYILKKLSTVRYGSVGELLHTLVEKFGKSLIVKVYDWKFAVGDGTNGTRKTLNIIHSEEIQNGPILKHKSQMERYLSTIMISYGVFSRQSHESTDQLWEINDFTILGELVYFFPNKKPISYEISMTNEEKREAFGKIAAGYSDAEYRRKFINISQSLLNWALDLSEDKKSVHPTLSQTIIQGILESVELTNSIHKNGEISKVIKDSIIRKWYDQFETVEYLGEEKSGELKLRLHHKKFVEAADKGLIEIGKNYDHATGGHVRCFLPNHGHTGKGTPSLYINPKKEFFKCYGNCGAWGYFSNEGTKGSETASVTNRRLINRSYSEIMSFKVPERYAEAMNIAQRIFQNQFLNSPGAKYLESKRKLNPEISMTLGAGFADQHSIHYMLDMGITYDELIEFGFVGISHNVKEHGPTSKMVELLKSRDFKLDQIQRPKDKTIDGVKVVLPALPFIVLDNRVTYPLDVNHVITHFYGRSVDENCPKSYSHQKTSPQLDIPQGGFNITNSMERAIQKVKDKPGWIPEIGITEAIIDADTMFQFGDLKEFGAFVGVNNRLLFQILATFPGCITTALNWDESKIVDGKETLMAGQRNTIKFVKFLQSINFGYPVYDFSEPFAIKVPGFNDLNGHYQKLWNDYWLGGKTQEAMSALLKPFDVLYTKKRIILAT